MLFPLFCALSSKDLFSRCNPKKPLSLSTDRYDYHTDTDTGHLDFSWARGERRWRSCRRSSTTQTASSSSSRWSSRFGVYSCFEVSLAVGMTPYSFWLFHWTAEQKCHIDAWFQQCHLEREQRKPNCILCTTCTQRKRREEEGKKTRRWLYKMYRKGKKIEKPDVHRQTLYPLATTATQCSLKLLLSVDQFILWILSTSCQVDKNCLQSSFWPGLRSSVSVHWNVLFSLELHLIWGLWNKIPIQITIL